MDISKKSDQYNLQNITFFHYPQANLGVKYQTSFSRVISAVQRKGNQNARKKQTLNHVRFPANTAQLYLPRVRVGRTTCKPGLNIMLLWIHWVTMQLTNELYLILCFTGCCLYEDCDKNPCDQLGNKDAVCSKMASCQSDKCNFDYKTAKASQRPTLPSRASRKFLTASVITLILTALAFLHQCNC